MAQNISDDEFDTVTRLDTEERYSYFVRQVCVSEQVWALRDDVGFVVMGDDSGEEYIPVWPAERFAAAYAGPGELPEAIPLSAWIERWLPGLARDNSGIAVFPVEGDSGAVVQLDEHRTDLEAEMNR